MAYRFPNQGWNPCPLQWKHRILTTAPPGKSPAPDCHLAASFWRGWQIICSHNVNSDSWSKRDPSLSPQSDSGIDISPHLCSLGESSPLSLGIIVSYVTLIIQQLEDGVWSVAERREERKPLVIGWAFRATLKPLSYPPLEAIHFFIGYASLSWVHHSHLGK